jgi:hypothetical protein
LLFIRIFLAIFIRRVNGPEGVEKLDRILRPWS